MMMGTKLFTLILIAGLLCCKKEALPPAQEKESTFERPYKVEVLNDHQVNCTYQGDTVSLFFENAYSLSEETVVYIKKN